MAHFWENCKKVKIEVTGPKTFSNKQKNEPSGNFVSYEVLCTSNFKNSFFSSIVEKLNTQPFINQSS